MDPGVLSAIVIAVGGVIVNQVTSRNNRRGQDATNLLETRRVGRDEFDSITRELRSALEDVRAELAEEREQRAASDAKAAEAEEHAREVARRADETETKAMAATRRLARRVEQLEQVLRDHDMPVPPAD